jgi:hypothetical protein
MSVLASSAILPKAKRLNMIKIVNFILVDSKLKSNKMISCKCLRSM